MGRSIAIKLAILLVVAALVYSVFWFFKVGQVEKQINKFVSDNSSYISATEVAVSGFPLSQKITIKNLKFTIPNAALDKNEVTVPILEATAGILESDYKVQLIEPLSVQDADGNISNIEFNSAPEITISIKEGNISKFHYQDSGYKIIAADKTIIYSANNTKVSVESSFELDKETHSISISAKEIEGFDVISLYKNTLEKKIIDGIKTGEVVLGNGVAETSEVVDPALNTTSQQITTIVTPLNSQKETAAQEKSNVETVTTAQVIPTNPTAATASAPQVENTEGVKSVIIPSETVVTSQDTTPVTSADSSSEASKSIATAESKNNLTIELEYVVSALGANSQEANIPLDPTQTQEAPTQQSKLIKIKNLELSNSLYTISVSGELSSLPDDNLPSGGVTIKIDKVDALVNQISSNFVKMAEKMKPAAELAEQPMAADLLSGTDTQSPASIDDPYQIFLTRVANGLDAVTKEISAKNAASKDNISQLDIRREKNLDFLINETSMREILGKF
ncbi:MAG: hypothetical protein KGP29_02945 [Proteobacteria bacterium]|nr:hypothetical protein [Pseudomonadota bacterium]